MADDVLVQKVFNYICGSGGFVELSVLFSRSAPLGSKKSEKEARNWLKTRAEFVLVQDYNGEDIGVRIDFKKKICAQYSVKGSCRWGRGKCKYWHICKSFIEGNCNGTCGLSHNFQNEDNVDKAKELRLQKYSNGALKNIVAWSLPRVCNLYQRNECKSDKCPYIHVCSQAVRGLSCHCALTHNLTDCHNMKVLKEYDLVPPRQVVSFDFVRCSILVLDEEQSVESRNSSKESHTTVARQPAVASDKCTARSRFSNGEAASVFFERLCKEFSCSAPLAKLQNQKVVLSNELEDFLSLLELHKDKFLVTWNERGTVQDVTAFCPSLRLCLDFVSLNECRKKQCRHFHLCRKFITGSCRRGENCPRSHSFRNKKDEETLSHLSLEGLTDEQLRQLMLSSSPQVCMDYNNRNCNGGSLCSRVHICKRFVMSACRNGDSCYLDHKQALDTLHTSSLIKKYKLDDSNLNNVLKVILVSEEHDNGYGCSHAARIGTSDSAPCSGLPAKDDDSVPKQSSQTSKSQQNRKRSFVSSSCSSEAAKDKLNPSKDAVFACICKEYDGSVPFAIISKRRDLFPGNGNDIANWFRERKENFLLREDADGTILEVSSFCPKARLCFNYLSSSGCSRDDCQYFHVCREYIAGCCKFFHRCKWSHDFQFDRDRKLISKLKLDGLTQEELCKVVQFSMPQVCLDYNAGSCRRGHYCGQIHMCKDFVKKRCHDEGDCGLQHENALLTSRAAAILENYGLECTDANTKSMLKELLVCENSSRPRTESQGNVIPKQTNLKLKTGTLRGADSGHIRMDNPDAPICSRFLSGECQKGVKCLKHHCVLPYHWLYNVPNIDEWKSFGEKDNLTLEKLYCDVSVDTQVNFQPAQALDVSSLKSEPGFLTLGQGYGIKIDFDNMVMHLIKNPSRVAFQSQLRRLSTITWVTQPCEIMKTNWTWFWKDNGNVWLKYGKDRSGRDLQFLIEQAFLEGKNRQMKFTTSAHEYNLFFYSNGMYQVNLQTGTKRPVRRRPGELICHEDVEDLMWKHGDSSVREQISRRCTKYKHIPSHWSAMPPNTQYERVQLMSCEDEYQSVEKLFRRTMIDNVIINRIDRVQNPFMLEKYCRKKENMMAVAKRTQQAVNEKQLFHGTSPDAVEAICKQNFDWRLHGKNATVYGEGSYFAVNASYSHTYAKKDVNSFQFMFLAKVLVGSYTTGHSSYRRPPSKNPSDPASDLYDSCVNNQANPTIFVVFDTDQFYPEYIIQYSAFTSAHALPQRRTAPSRPNPYTSQPLKGILKHPASSSTAVTSASHALQQASTSPSRPKPPPSQPLKRIYSSTSLTFDPNGSATRSRYPSTATGRNAYLSKSSTHVALATNAKVSVSQNSHSSKAPSTNPSRSLNSLRTGFIASSSSVRSGYPPATSSNQIGSAAQSVTQASAPSARYATPSKLTSSVYSSTSHQGSSAATTASALKPPQKKKKDCLIM